MKLIILKTYGRVMEAHIDKTKLLSEGIECFVEDQEMTGLNPIMSTALGGVKLKVREEDFEKAKDLLLRLEKENGEK